MTIKPGYFGSKGGSGGGDSELLADMPLNEVFVKNASSDLVGTGMRLLADGTLLAPEKFQVESGSINFGDLITISEAAGFLALWNHLNNKQYQMVDYYVPRDEPTHNPRFFRLYEAEWEFAATTDGSTTLTNNPCTFNYTTQLDARTNKIVLYANQAMTNVKLRVKQVASNVVIKYLPSKASWLGHSAGYNLVPGMNVIDLMDSPVPLTAGDLLEFEIVGDNISLLGSVSGIPKFSTFVQRGTFIDLATELDITPQNIKYLLETLSSPYKLSKDAIQDAVLSVNGQFGDVILTASSVDAQPESDVLTRLAELSLTSQILIGTDDNGDIELIPYTNFSKSLLSSEDSFTARGFLQLGTSATKDTGVVNGVVPLNSSTKIDSTYLDLATVSFTGSYSDLLNKPVIPSAQIQSDWTQANTSSLDYIKNKPTIPVVNYPVTSVNTKTGAVVLNNVDVGAAATIHSHTISDVTGLQTALDNKITIGASIPYSTLTGTPTIPTNGSFTFIGLSDTDNTIVANGFLRWNSSGTSVSYSTTIPYALLSGAPSLATVATTGSYNDLINKPTIPSGQVNSDWTAVSGVTQILNKPVLFDGTWTSLTGKPTFATVATSGSYVDLINKPTIPTTTTQISEGTNLYYTNARVASYLAANSYKKVEMFQGTTNASGVYQVTFANTYTLVPHVNPVMINNAANYIMTLTNVTTTGCTVTILQRSAVTLLAVEVLLAATVPVSGATVGVLVVSKD